MLRPNPRTCKCVTSLGKGAFADATEDTSPGTAARVIGWAQSNHESVKVLPPSMREHNQKDCSDQGYTAGCEDGERGPRAKECGKPLETGETKEMASP